MTKSLSLKVIDSLHIITKALPVEMRTRPPGKVLYVAIPAYIIKIIEDAYSGQYMIDMHEVRKFPFEVNGVEIVIGHENEIVIFLEDYPLNPKKNHIRRIPINSVAAFMEALENQ
jgi:hypothetical protein